MKDRVGVEVVEELPVTARSRDAEADTVLSWWREFLSKNPDADLVDWDYDRSRRVVTVKAVMYVTGGASA